MPSGLIARARPSSSTPTSGGAAPGWRLPAPPRPDECRGPTERERERLSEGEAAALPAPPRPYVRYKSQ